MISHNVSLSKHVKPPGTCDRNAEKRDVSGLQVCIDVGFVDIGSLHVLRCVDLPNGGWRVIRLIYRILWRSELSTPQDWRKEIDVIT
jgi:hypothetical protein